MDRVTVNQLAKGIGIVAVWPLLPAAARATGRGGATSAHRRDRAQRILRPWCGHDDHRGASATG
jgi:hypothetical protein